LNIYYDLVAGTELGKKIASLLKGGIIRAYTTELNITELRYILCRKVGRRRSLGIVDRLTRSRYIKIIDVGEISERAALLKCQRAPSLVWTALQ